MKTLLTLTTLTAIAVAMKVGKTKQSPQNTNYYGNEIPTKAKIGDMIYSLDGKVLEVKAS